MSAIATPHSCDILNQFVDAIKVAAVRDGIPPDVVRQRLLVEGILLAAQLHRDTDGDFVRMARHAQSLIQTGSVVQ